ncbi:unnamed protein product, partial [Eretmochelys imbricata]
MCERHQEPLKLYCKEDQIPLCLVCDRSWRHRHHTVVPMEEAIQEYRTQTQTPFNFCPGKKIAEETELQEQKGNRMGLVSVHKDLGVTELPGWISTWEQVLISHFVLISEISRARGRH